MRLELLFDDGVGVLCVDDVLKAVRFEMIAEDLDGEPRVALVEVKREDREVDGSDASGAFEEVKHDPGVFSAADADHDPIAFFNKSELGVGHREFFRELGFDISRHETSMKGAALARARYEEGVQSQADTTAECGEVKFLRAKVGAGRVFV